jgi:hypothetical protein
MKVSLFDSYDETKCQFEIEEKCIVINVHLEGGKFVLRVPEGQDDVGEVSGPLRQLRPLPSSGRALLDTRGNAKSVAQTLSILAYVVEVMNDTSPVGLLTREERVLLRLRREGLLRDSTE